MVINRQKKKIETKRFTDIINYLKPNDVLIFNDTKVFPARLIMKRKETGGKIEIFLLNQIKPYVWSCLVGGNRRKEGLEAELGKIKAKLIKYKPDKTWEVKFNLTGKKLMDEVFKVGTTPTPPYIKEVASAARYQTTYARRLGSVAAPTAGFHFTPSLIKKIQQKGIQTLFVTLHVGLGTFEPIKSDTIEKHQLHAELAEINAHTAKQLNQAIQDKKRIIAVGTTSTRTLEGFIKNKNFQAHKKWINTYIYPGYKFKVVDAMITNFHLPQSSLIVLVSAFAGKSLIMKAYKKAIKEKYRFYSFGDGMFIL